MNWVLISVLVIIAAGVITGLSRGLIKMVFSALSIVIVVTLTSIISPFLTTYIEKNTKWDERVEDRTEIFLTEHGIIKDNINIDTDDIPLPSLVRDKVSDAAQGYMDRGVREYNDYVVKAVSGVILRAMVYAILFLALIILSAVLNSVLGIISRLPVLKELNRAGGALIGAAVGILLIWLIFLMITVFGSTKAMVPVFRQIDENAFLSFLYDNNPLMNLLLSVF